MPALRWLAGWIAEKHGLTVELSSESVPARLAEDMNVLLFESIREILFNVVKHAAVDDAHVDVRYADNKLRIAVLDEEGLGFDPDSVHSSGTSGAGFGLFSIRERLGLLGGELEIDSAPGKGTRVTLNAPVTLASSVRPRTRRAHPHSAGRRPSRHARRLGQAVRTSPTSRSSVRPPTAARQLNSPRS